MLLPRRGVRYYRSLPPPEDEWGPDYAAIAGAGLHFVVVPVPWALSHVDEEQFDFSPLLSQLHLARQNGLQVIADIGLGAAPLWLVRRHPDFLCQHLSSHKVISSTPQTIQDAGWPRLCLDNEGARASAGCFLRALATAVGVHPSLAAYQLAPTTTPGEPPGNAWVETCRCPASVERFVSWLRRKYADDLNALGAAWSQRVTAWADVAPLCYARHLPVNMDWMRFQMENAAAHFRWFAAALRESSPNVPIIAGVRPLSGQAIPDADIIALPVNTSADAVSRLLPHESADCVAASRRGCSVWLENLPTWDVREVRLAHWSALASGADAMVYDAWRPERFFPARRGALAQPDGAPNQRLAEANRFAELCARHPHLASAHPYPPEAAVGILQESAALLAASASGEEEYFAAVLGAYRALSARGAQVALATPEQWASFRLVYLPMAISISGATAETLRRYVEGGGCVVAEASTARFSESGISTRLWPGCGLDELFGAQAIEVREVRADGEPPTFRGRHGSFPCIRQWEPLRPTTGVVKARFNDGTAAIVDHAFGNGATRLIATYPSLGCAGADLTPHARVILDSLAFARVKPRLFTSSPNVTARLLKADADANLLCVFTTSLSAQEVKLRIDRAVGRFRRAHDLVTGKPQRLLNNGLRIRLFPGDGLLLRLEPATRIPRLPRWRPRRRPGRD